MNAPEVWREVKSFIDTGSRFILTTHINPDGDALGSEMALAELLRGLKKEVFIINKTPTPANYQFLDPYQEIIIYEAERDREVLHSADLYFILDISDWNRLQDIGSVIRETTIPKICIDHHHCPEKFADLDIIDEKASSTGELIFDLLQYCHTKIQGRMAEALYTCVLTDTGSFRFSNTTPRAHQIAAHLLKVGVDSREIYQEVYERNSPAKMKLLGYVLQDLHYECQGQLVWFAITRNMLSRAGAHTWDTEGFPEIPRSIDGVEISLMFTELEDKRVKMSLRSKGRIAINTVAQKFGGGGHRYASGALMQCSINDAIESVVEEAKELFKERSLARE